MNPDVFPLLHADGRPFRPATQASALAKYSRSWESMREIIAKMTDEDGERFQEKYDVGWGHSSVGELAAVPYCFEGVSIIASKFLERPQRAGYSEKSTRYQVFTRNSFINPPGSHPSLRQAADVLYNAYEQLTGPVTEYFRRKLGAIKVGDSVIKARAFDSLRYLLPAGTGTNLAAVLNARDARHLMNGLLGSSNVELLKIGSHMLEAARKVAPVFAMDVDADTFEPEVESLGPIPVGSRFGKTFVDLQQPDNVAAIVRRFWQDVQSFYGMLPDEFDAHMRKRGRRQVPKVFRNVRLSFDIIMDYGAFRDLQRHRRCEQFVEPLKLDYGYVLPDDMRDTEFEPIFIDAIERNRGICEALLKHCSPTELQYALPLCTLHRTRYVEDMQETYYVCELRTQPQGHLSYRRIAWERYEKAKQLYPDLMQWCQPVEPVSAGLHT